MLFLYMEIVKFSTLETIPFHGVDQPRVSGETSGIE